MSIWGGPRGLLHNLQIQLTRLYKQGSTNKVLWTRTTFKHRSRYSPTSSQGRVFVEQASVVVYLTRFAVNFFPYDSLNARKRRNYYQRATYKDNLSTCPQPRILFWFTSSSFLKRPVLFEVLAPTSLFLRGSYMQKQYRKRTTLRSESSTIKGLLYAPDPEKREKGTLSDQPRLSRVTSTALLCCWGRSRSKIWRPLGLTLRCMPYGRGTLRIPPQSIL